MRLSKPLTVCVFGYSERDEGGRVWALLAGLAENGVTITSCRTLVPGYFAKLSYLYRTWQQVKDSADALYVVFMGYYLMPLAWYLARRRGIPVILDTLASQYDTEVTDRKRVSSYNPWAWFLWVVDFISCHMADAIVVDTQQHRHFFVHTFYVDVRKIVVVPVGCRSDLFVPLSLQKPNDAFIVEFHGGISRLQGVEYIMEAAKILQDKQVPIRFEITGVGQLSSEITSLAKTLQLENVTFFGRKTIQELPYSIARGDLCLGIFGITGKALRVIPNKVYECLSCGKAVITERSPAALTVLHDYEDVVMVEPGNGQALAEKILELQGNLSLRRRLAKNARALSLTTFSPRTIVEPLIQWLTAHP